MTDQKPQRMRLSRAKGFDLQRASLALNGLPAVIVSRPTAFGNPFKVGIDGTAAECVDLYRMLLAYGPCLTSKVTIAAQRRARDAVRNRAGNLVGRNLACWCAPGAPCHADVILEFLEHSNDK